MRWWGIATTLVLVLAGCDGEPETAVTPSQAQSLPAPGTARLDAAKAQPLQAALAKIVAFPDSPAGSRGATAAVVSDRWTWSGAAGKDISGTALRPDTSIAVASITKTFVAAEVMLLAQAKKVDLDAPISTYVKHKLTTNNATVRQHLSMTAGVPDFLPDDYFRLDGAVAAAPGRHWTAVQTLSYLTAPIEAPNSTFSYSNPSYLLLGELIESVTGQPFAAAVRRDLAAPAGLRHAAFQDGEKPQPPVATDHNESCGGQPDGYLPCRAFASAVGATGSLAADAPTVAHWGYQLYGGRVLPMELVGEMTTGDGDYGLGTMLFTRLFGIGTAFGHRGDMPDSTSLLVVIPEKKLSIALLLADGDRHIDTGMGELTKALEPLLS